MRLTSEICVAGNMGRIYSVERGGVVVLLDVGPHEACEANLRELEEDAVDLSKTRAILVTHAHWDHAGALAAARARLGCPVVAHAREADWIETGDRLATGATRTYHDACHPFPPCPVDHRIDDQDTLVIGPLRFRAHHLPGHSPGSVGYELDGNLFCGDVIMADGGVGWCDIHWGSNLPAYRESLRKIMRLRPRLFLPGHGSAFPYRAATLRAAVQRLDFIQRAGSPVTLPETLPRRKPRPGVVVVRGQRRATKKPQPREAPLSPLFELRTEQLIGAVRPSGAMHGLILAADGAPITTPGLCTMNLEHYFERGRAGEFVPRLSVPTYYEPKDDSILVHFYPVPDWPVEAQVEYRVRPGARVDVTFNFHFKRDFEDFEAFIASYFHGSKAPYLRVGGGWLRPRIPPRAQLFFPRDAASRTLIADGRFDYLAHHNLQARAHRENYSAPLTVHLDERTGSALIQMVERERCSSLSVNTFAWAQDFSLVGRTVRAGEKVRVRASVVHRRITRLGDVLEEYEKFRKPLSRK